MVREFISPNWHVLFLHFPLALIIVGTAIEIFSCFWKHSSIRSAARWMILLGALGAAPTAITGVYAFADAAKAASDRPSMDWSELVSHSHWGAAQWHYMKWHIWLNSSATILFLATVVAFLGASDQWRRRLRAPLLLVLVIGIGLVASGAWFGGESVYRYRVAVDPQSPGESASAVMTGNEKNLMPEWVQKYTPPMQVHMLLVGLTISLVAAAVGVTIRRFHAVPEPISEPESHRPVMEAELEHPHVAALPAEPYLFVPPARFWVLGLLLALGAAAAGVWAFSDGGFNIKGISKFVKNALTRAGTKDDMRMFIHLALGVSIIVLLLLLAGVAHWCRRARMLSVILILLLLGAVGVQIWYGVKLLYGLA